MAVGQGSELSGAVGAGQRHRCDNAGSQADPGHRLAPAQRLDRRRRRARWPRLYVVAIPLPCRRVHLGREIPAILRHTVGDRPARCHQRHVPRPPDDYAADVRHEERRVRTPQHHGLVYGRQLGRVSFWGPLPGHLRAALRACFHPRRVVSSTACRLPVGR